MESRNLAIGIIFLLQSTVGILGNFTLLFYYLVLHYSECTIQPVKIILMHLIILNSLIILCKGLSNTLATLGLKLFFNDLGYQLFLYLLRILRSVSIGTTCLFNVFQAITISPRNSCGKDLKVKAPNFIGLLISFLWVLYVMVNFIFPVYMYNRLNRKNVTKESDFEPYTVVGHDEITASASFYVAFFVFPEVLCSVLIVWSSGSMIVLLYRHKQYIHSSRASRRASPQTRATRSILALVLTFLAFFSLSSILHGCIALLYAHNWWLVNITAIIYLCFPTFGPFVLISQDSTVSGLCLS